MCQESNFSSGQFSLVEFVSDGGICLGMEEQIKKG